MSTPSNEFAFELRVCRWAERHWPPDGERAGPVIVARQFGAAGRRWDTIVIECDPDELGERAAFGQERLDGDLLDVVRYAPAEWAYYREALPDPGYPWRYVRESIHRADDRGILETRRRGNRIEIRRRFSYPDWVERIVAIENKPDLDASAARALSDQLERDVAMGLADEVWIAIEADDDRVSAALFEDVPVEAGIVEVDSTALTADVAWYPRTLAVDRPGTRILERPDGGAHDASAAQFEYVEASEKRERRLEIAERAYERGWRSYVDTMRPDCRHFEGRTDGQLLPYCRAKGRQPTARECAGSCPAFEPEPPTWRTRGWPIEGGPGARIKQILADRRERRR
ncbi:hypothetical protein Halru_2485 [Halovivax ruber XH-70]|uniref:Uncharacterized protein n=1 Tax=Halovivax ruber (strain DSM 18193 / JCM 13892 / XH-70) TaxID=797302 RepID=L0IGE9_HALRX|nr:DUF5787 family protein [Halovivax ruber]AGB17067.1 hypothetical protein Halru_2485 [Halovivax ruber XH-70]